MQKVDNLKQELHEQQMTICELDLKIKISEKDQLNIEKEKQVNKQMAQEMRQMIQPQVSVILNLKLENEEVYN